jgi:hypothetical protein
MVALDYMLSTVIIYRSYRIDTMSNNQNPGNHVNPPASPGEAGAGLSI